MISNKHLHQIQIRIGDIGVFFLNKPVCTSEGKKQELSHLKLKLLELELNRTNTKDIIRNTTCRLLQTRIQILMVINLR